MDTVISPQLKKEDDLGIVVNSELENHISATEKKNQNCDKEGGSYNTKSNNCRKGKIIPGFAREVIVKVAELCEQEASKNVPLFSLNAPTKRAAMYTGVSVRTIQRIRGEDRKRKLERDKIDISEEIEHKKRKNVDCPDKEINYEKLKKQGHKGQVIPNSARDIISKVIDSCYKEFEDGEYLAPLICRSRRTALYTGVSVRTIQRIKQEDEVRNKINQEKLLTTPGRKRRRSTFRDKIDDFDFHCIRMLVDELILNKKVFPTCGSLLKVVKESNISFPYGEDTLFRLLHGKGFNWRTGQKGKKILVEKEEIFRGRTSCIRKIKSHETEGKFIVYLDDKCIGVDADNMYCDKNGIFGTEGGICCSGRIVAITEYSAMGMARRGFRNIRPNANTSEPLPVMSTVEKWLKENLFPNIPERSLIIMSTDAFNQNDVSVPNEYSTKPILIKFLKHKKLKYENTSTWADLYDVVKKYLESLPSQATEFDKIIEKHGHVPLRLPVYMSEFSPIELACADIKRYLREKITITKAASLNIIKETTLEAIQKFQTDTFQGYVNHVINMEDYFLNKEKDMQDHYDSVTKKDSSNNNPLGSSVDHTILTTSGTNNVNNLELHRPSTSHNFATSNHNRKCTSIEETSSNMFLTMPPHSQIVYGKTVATPVIDKFEMCTNQDLDSDAVQPAPSYLNL